MDSEAFGVGFIIGIILGLLMGLAIMDIARNSEREITKGIAIDSGAAYYKLDAKTGVSTFTWKHLEKAEK